MPGQNICSNKFAFGHLRIGLWNIHGHHSSTLGNKLKLDEVINIIKKYDIFATIETHATPSSDLDINSYYCYKKFRKSSGKKVSGGIALYVNRRIKEGVKYIATKNENILWCKLDKHFFQIERDIFLGSLYFSPNNYEKANNQDYLSDLEQEIINFSYNGDIILQGDYNARTGLMNECVLYDDNRFIEFPEDYDIDTPLARSSKDGTTDGRGKQLIELCSSNNLRIVNGRMIGDLFGNKTCFQYNGSSLVDYVICSTNLMSKFGFLKINDLLPHISDHCEITFNLKIGLTSLTPRMSVPKINMSTHNRMSCPDNCKMKIKEIVNSEEYQTKLKNLMQEHKN